jgi:uncharacterized protein YndB with AHSA1/START domain
VVAGSDPELVVSREIDAPRSLVFRALTQQEHAAQWWGPQGFTTVSCKMDARPGGTYRQAMRGPDGVVRTKRGVYREVMPERIVFTYAWEDAQGNPGHDMLVTITLEDIGARTKLTLHQTGFESIPERDGHRTGWTSCIERFATWLAASREGI